MMCCAATATGGRLIDTGICVPSAAVTVAVTVVPVLIWRTSPGCILVACPAIWNCSVAGTPGVKVVPQVTLPLENEVGSGAIEVGLTL